MKHTNEDIAGLANQCIGLHHIIAENVNPRGHVRELMLRHISLYNACYVKDSGDDTQAKVNALRDADAALDAAAAAAGIKGHNVMATG